MSAVPQRQKRDPKQQRFSNADTQALLRCARTFLPTGDRGWERVWTRYRASYAKVKHQAVRDGPTLRTKFAELLDNKIPTESPLCPPNVREAREIQALIQTKASRPPGSYSNDDMKSPEQSSRSQSAGSNEEVKVHHHEGPAVCVAQGNTASKLSEKRPKLLERKHSASQVQPHGHGHGHAHPSHTGTHTPAVSTSKPSPLSAKRLSTPIVRPGHSAKKRKVEPLAKDMEEQAERVVLRLQLASESAERQRLQHKVDRLEMKMDDLRESHRKDVERLRGKNIKLKLKLNRVLGALCVLRATQQSPQTETE
ncbi:hypothetical protein PHYBOEH_010981 [Phytophthora boehmeriae]|uniref:DUF6818 domain-containing protein n=1 Tax=Phytophthora boehmeriae TaxID=109152 RepID=A0A8T1VMJ3_9STRA|nr:hypothetical protein PHYBOEH_010981 [Phytophthora boehmeriae]